MSMDFRKTTYKPKRTETRFRTNYALMSQWMSQNKPTRSEVLSAVYGKKLKQPDGTEINPYTDHAGSKPRDFAAAAAIEDGASPRLRYSENGGYDDFHKAFRAISTQWPNSSFPTFGPPRLRQGRAGGSWRHVKEVLQAGGHRIVFVDGQIRYEDTIKMDEVPGGHLIQNQAPEAVNGRTHFYSINAPEGGRRTGMRREKTSANKIHGNLHELETKMALEHNNWNVMR